MANIKTKPAVREIRLKTRDINTLARKVRQKTSHTADREESTPESYAESTAVLAAKDSAGQVKKKITRTVSEQKRRPSFHLKREERVYEKGLSEEKTKREGTPGQVHAGIKTQTMAEKTAAAAKSAEIRARKGAALQKSQRKREKRILLRRSGASLARGARAAISLQRRLVLALGAGGISVGIIGLVLLMAGVLANSSFGIFLSPDTGGQTMAEAVREIDREYSENLERLAAAVSYDEIRQEGRKTPWKDILSVYAVKTATDPEDPLEVATVSEEKKEILRRIFGEMNAVGSNIEKKTGSEERTVLTLRISGKTALEMADQYGFDQKQRQQLEALLGMEQSMWSRLLYGTHGGNGEIVEVALSQLGNVGGEPYWRWYGFGGRVEWCAIFVSWCADQCGYLEADIIPRYAGCGNGMRWFQGRGQWATSSAEPEPGWVIFFDWYEAGGQDGLCDHTGIVEKCENGTVYTIEGNSGDACRQRQYAVGSPVIMGYGVPQYG